MATPEMLSIPEAATLLHMPPIEALAQLYLSRLAHPPEVVFDRNLVESARHVLHLSPEEEAAPPALSQDASLAAEVDVLPRRRVGRLLLDRMHRRGYWGTSRAQLSSLRRGFGNPEAEWVPEMLEKLTGAGLLISFVNARHNKAEPLFGLNPERRDEILGFIETGRLQDGEVSAWFRA